MKKLVVAIGGNALAPASESADATAQRRRIDATCARLPDLIQAGHDVVLTHGNGPQVGNIPLQNEATRPLAPAMTLATCRAAMRGSTGSLHAQSTDTELKSGEKEKKVVLGVSRIIH